MKLIYVNIGYGPNPNPIVKTISVPFKYLLTELASSCSSASIWASHPPMTTCRYVVHKDSTLEVCRQQSRIKMHFYGISFRERHMYRTKLMYGWGWETKAQLQIHLLLQKHRRWHGFINTQHSEDADISESSSLPDSILKNLSQIEDRWVRRTRQPRCFCFSLRWRWKLWMAD